ncbi:MAG: DUF2442 domain-containing protein [Thermodesulfobacteriota bacterium]
MHYVTEATYVDGYQIKVRFENNEIKLVDLRSHLHGPVFEPLKDLSFFKKVEVNTDIDTIAWPNAADFSPDFLYEIGHLISEQRDAVDG